MVETNDVWCASVVFQGFDDPHALAVGSGGEAIYVGEMNPENIWKFEKEGEDQWTTWST